MFVEQDIQNLRKMIFAELNLIIVSKQKKQPKR